ncbi:hypothetical protein ACLVWU_02180 [Bdellovibrio sp. HCB290]|uniref:hypothetical protein n=1 Tax=Bdellovibrio sp. HCB290 TaxID=3394356 RepID=UPI0039B4042E
MRKYVEGKIFKDELELWFFLQDLKGKKLGVPDGHYCIEFLDKPEGLRFRMMLRFAEMRTIGRVLWTRPMEPRFYFYVKNDEVFCMGVESRYLHAREEILDGRWQLVEYCDVLSPAEGPEMYFTPEAYAKACDALVEALIMQTKKVS